MLQAEDQGEKFQISRKTKHDILLALGANLTSSFGAPSETLNLSINELARRGASIRFLSAFYSTPAFPAGNGPDYVNAAVRLSAEWTAEETLSICHEIEAAMGRTRDTRWGQRTLDIDLIGYDDQVLPDQKTFDHWHHAPLDMQRLRAPEEMIVPHPRMQDRAFVLVPLADVAPDWVHPVIGKTVRALRDALDPADLSAVKPLQ